MTPAGSVVATASFTHAVNDGPLLVAMGVAALVGLVGFLSPCVLPLVPGYLSYVAGLSGADDARNQRRMVAGALLFVLGFSAVFVLAGVAFGAFGAYIRNDKLVIERVFGVITIVLGLAFMGWLPFMQREFKVHHRPPAGLLGAPLLGITFGAAWGPCLTPTLGAVNSMAYTTSSAGRGAILLAAYCLGLGVPFVLVALGFGWVTSALGFVRRHRGAVSRIGGLLLVVMGVLLVTGTWDHWTHLLQDQFQGSGVGSGL
jgi:cytochrome c-type biogenesis protein